MPRKGEPEETANSTLPYALDDSSFVMEIVLSTSGGWTAC